MNKRIHTVILQPGTDEALFLANEAAGMEVVSNLNMFDSIISMRLSEDEVTTLKASEKVIDVEFEPPVVETAYPITPKYSRSTKLKTRLTPSTSGPGSAYAGTNFWFTGGADLSSNTGPVGFFTTGGEDAEIDAVIKQNYAGEFVDIVAVEAGTPNSFYADVINHPDFKLTGQNAQITGQAQTIELTITPNGSSSWLVSGTDRSTTHTNASNPTINIREGDTLKIINTATSSHPIEVVQTLGTQVSEVINQGAYDGKPEGNVLEWTPSDGQSVAFDGSPSFVNYRCSIHTSTMNGQIQVSELPSRFVPTDWTTYDSALVDSDQATGGAEYFSNHAIGVLSAAGGSYCGWSKVSSLRVVYLANGVAAAYNGVLNFHNNKPVNPETGVRNATIVTGAWGFVGVDLTGAVWVERINTIEGYDTDGNLSVISRPPGGWGNDLTPFTDNLMAPRVINDPADGTDKWMIAWHLGSRYTTLDTIMNNYNNAGGIYHFKSAGNNSAVGCGPDDPRSNNRIYIDNSIPAVDLNLDGDGKYVFASYTTASSPSTVFAYPVKSYSEGGENQITVGACQQSTINPLMDDYSNRGPMIDISGTGAYTWTAYQVGNYTDAGWGYFSGTSCAAPQAAGTASVIVCDFFTKRGVYPTIAQLKELMLNNSEQVLESEGLVNFASVPSAGNIASSRLYSSTDVFRISEGDFQNGGSDLSDLFGSRTDRINIPYSIRLGTGKYVNAVRGPSYGRRPNSGQTYPRRKIRVGA